MPELAEEDSLYAEAPNAKQVAYITRLVTGVNEHAAELDGYIAKYAKNWKFSRIPLVASAIMRVAMYEILYMAGHSQWRRHQRSGGDRQKIRDAGNREIYQRNSGQLRAGGDLPVSIGRADAAQTAVRSVLSYPPGRRLCRRGGVTDFGQCRERFMEQRNRGIDLLRMTAMWMVVILHILNKGGVLAGAAPLSLPGAADRTAAGGCRPTARSTATG